MDTPKIHLSTTLIKLQSYKDQMIDILNSIDYSYHSLHAIYEDLYQESFEDTTQVEPITPPPSPKNSHNIFTPIKQF